MDWRSFLDPASVVGGFATGLAAGIALVALIAAFVQIRANARVARESFALQCYSDYLRLCFENPNYSSSYLAAKTASIADWTGVADRLTPESEKYLWFLSILLNACEQVLMNVPPGLERGGTRRGNAHAHMWESVLVRQLSYHDSALRVLWDDWKDDYDRRVDDLVRKATDRHSKPKR